MIQPPPVDDRQPDQVDPSALLLGAEEGEEWALGRLHAEHNAPLLRYLRTHADGGEDRLAACTWIAASGRFAELPDSGQGFRGWLLRIAREEVARDRRPPRWSDDDTTDRLLARVEIPAGGPAAFAAESLAGDAAIARITEALPNDQAEVVVLAVVGHCTVDEIAVVTGRPRREVRAVQEEAGTKLEQIFGATELFRHMERAGRTVPTEPPPGLLPAMAEAARRSRKGPRAATALAAKVAIVGLVLVGTATGAAATGTLPEAAQQGLATIAAKVGLDFPGPAEDPATGESDQEVPTVDSPTGDDPTADSPSTENHGADVSDVARNTDATGADKGKQIADTARDGNRADRPAPTEDRGSPPSSQPPDPPAPEPAPEAPAPTEPPSSSGGGGAPSGGPNDNAKGGGR